MKKRLILKIVLNVLLIFSIFFSIYEGIQTLQLVRVFPENVTVAAQAYRRESVCFFLSAFMQIVFLILLDFTGVKFLFNSVLKDIKEHKDSTAEARKQKRIESLEKELEELKSDSNKDNM